MWHCGKGCGDCSAVAPKPVCVREKAPPRLSGKHVGGGAKRVREPRGHCHGAVLAPCTFQESPNGRKNAVVPQSGHCRENLPRAAKAYPGRAGEFERTTRRCAWPRSE